jgi:hypothetical protein
MWLVSVCKIAHGPWMGNNTLCSSAVSSQAYGLNDSSIASLAGTHNIHRAVGSNDTKCARTDPAYEC